MVASIAVVGPGRVGRVLARLWHESGLRVIGFRGRDPARARDAAGFCGAGRVLEDDVELRTATAVVVATADSAVADVVARAAAAGGVGRRALWVHVSGVLDLSALAVAEECGARIGALHPVCPVPDADGGYAAMPGRFALLEGPPGSLRPMRVLARAAGLRPVVGTAVDRALYHAACALLANGGTSLAGLGAALIGRSAGLDGDVGQAVAVDLMRSALDLTAARGARDALSGPVARGDADVVRVHRDVLEAAGEPGAESAYVALMHAALSLARARGLSRSSAEAVEAALGGDVDGG